MEKNNNPSIEKLQITEERETLWEKYLEINKKIHDEWEKKHVEDMDECIF